MPPPNAVYEQQPYKTGEGVSAIREPLSSTAHLEKTNRGLPLEGEKPSKRPPKPECYISASSTESSSGRVPAAVKGVWDT